MKVSSMNNLMIPLSLGGGPKKQAILVYPGAYTGNRWNAQVPQSTQMCVKVATLSKPLINNLTFVMNTLKPNPRLRA